MASTRRKAAAVAIAIVGIAGLSLASAATLNISSDQLAAGTINVSGCDDAVTASYVTTYNSGTKAYDVSGVTLTGIAAACFDATPARASITLVTGSGEVTVASAVALTGATQSFALASNTPAAGITDVAVVFNG